MKCFLVTLGVCTLCLCALRTLAQGVPIGSEFRVNTYTTTTQSFPSVASDSSGNVIVVWRSLEQDGSGAGVFGQRYASTGAPAGADFRVNTYTTNNQSSPSVASDSAGSFIVIWQSGQSAGVGQDGSGYGVFGQRYASTGAPAGAEFRVNTYTTSLQQFPSVASDSAGSFVVVWESYTQDGSYDGVFGQRYASSGAPAGAEFRVNTYTTDRERFPSVASASAGSFVVVWESASQDGSSLGVFGQRYASTGAPAGAEFRVNTTTANQQRAPRIASDSAGNFVVVWQSYTQDGSVWGAFGQRYASTGAPAGAEFRVNTLTSSHQLLPSVASDSAGSFVVVWQSLFQDGSAYGVFGQRYASTGAPAGAEFRVNAYTTNGQYLPSVASDSAGYFVVVWRSSGQQGGLFPGVFGQRYGKIFQPGLLFSTVAPCRVVDTRDAAGPFGGPPLQPGATRPFSIPAGSCGVPLNASAISANIAVTNTAAVGYLTLWPADGTQPLASSINFTAGQTRSNNVVVPVSGDGTGSMKVFTGSLGTVDFILDVNGYFR